MRDSLNLLQENLSTMFTLLGMDLILYCFP